MRETLSLLPTNTGAQGHGLPTSESGNACRNAQPTAVVAALQSTTTTGAQTLAVIAQQQLLAAARSRTKVTNVFGETLRSVNDDVSVIEASLFPMATAPQSLKIGVLGEIHPCGGLIIDLPGEELISSDDDNEE
uniref:Uncharacterized protein n=1 Tax=Romanomermis culicivorax TaxID=13658 RepID=A0A915KC27_ROMCU